MTIILASASPRRQQLLEQVHCQFVVIASDVEEDNAQQLEPAALAVKLAADKAAAVAAGRPAEDVVIGADTIVVLDGQVFGKPQSRSDARRMLQALRGREHQVITGIAVAHQNQIFTEYGLTRVKLLEADEDMIERYLDSGEPLDKAGAYAIQGLGALLVEEIHGCYNNVVGLPLTKLAGVLKRVGICLL